MRRHLIVGAVLAAVVAAAIGATMAFAGGDSIPTCGATTACPSYRVEWQNGPPQAFQYDADQVVGQATIVGLGGAGARPTFDVYAYNWGVGQIGTSLPGGGGGAGRSENQDFTIVKYVDELTPLLSVSCESGTHFPTAIVVVKAKTGTMTYAFQDISCSLDKQGSTGQMNSQPLEQFSWTYRRIEWTFTSRSGATVTRCWNVAVSEGGC